MKSKLVVLLFSFLSFYIYLNRQEYKLIPLESDPSGYYAYLPAVFIYHDLAHLDFVKKVNRSYHINGDCDFYGIYDNPNGNRTDKYAIGSSLFELPFFLLARCYCFFDKNHPDDGYSMPFEIMVAISTLFWTTIGLIVLRKFLLRHFTDPLAAATLICIGFGTNLYYFTGFSPCSVHNYAFIAIACVVYFTDLWYATNKRKYLYLVAVFSGVVIITRPVDIVIVLFCLFWMVDSVKSLKERGLLFIRNYGSLTIALLFFLLVSLIQMSYWKYTSGHWIYYSYVEEGFNFSKPQIWNGLFSWRKGWFIYTPMALVAMYGFVFLWQQNKKMLAGPILFLICFIYIVFSWHMWWYGASFSSRPLVDAMPVVAIPLAAFLRHTFSLSSRILKTERLVLIVFFIALNMFQSYQYSLMIIDCSEMTVEYYWHVFGKVKINFEESRKLLNY